LYAKQSFDSYYSLSDKNPQAGKQCIFLSTHTVIGGHGLWIYTAIILKQDIYT